ncbi:hypothetical protein N9V96_02505 [Polaribacter sp.]|nr:hypothetical protein [Polaribacter sp.]
MKKFIFLIVFTILVSCETDSVSMEDVIYIVASKKVDCTGVDLQKCFLVK